MFELNHWLRPFTRITSTHHRYIPEVDGLRFFAIVTVFLYHAGTHIKRTTKIDFSIAPEATWLDWFTSRAGLGVDVFFAISGFILALPFAKHYLLDRPAIPLKAYYIRRLTRLEPPYVISLLGFFLLLLIVGEFTFQEGLPHFLASLFYLHNIIYDQWSSINPVAWSLEVEVQFYLLAPLFFSVFMIRSTKGRRLFLIGLIILMIVLSHQFRDAIEALHLRKSILVYLQTFSLGILLADLQIVPPKKELNKSVIDLFGIIGLVLLWKCSQHYLSISLAIGFHLGIFLLFLATLKGRFFKSFFSIPIIAVIGGMCYTIYLLHYAVIAFIAPFLQGLVWTNYYEINYFIQTAIFGIVVLFISGIYFLLIEKPCMRKNWHLELWEKISNRFSGKKIHKIGN